jgi:hypothetical protein
MSDAGDPHVLEPGHAPTPFSAAEIRDGSPVGLTATLRIEEAGEPPWTQVTRFVSWDPEGADRLAYRVAADGTSTERTTSRSTWLQLQRHASYPTDAVTIEDIELDTPMGRLDCLRYAVVNGDETVIHWFARSMPGMPIQTVVTNGGREVERVTMLSREVVPAEDWT